MDRLSIFADPDRGRSEADLDVDGGSLSSTASSMDDVLIEELELGVRSYNCLKREGIRTVGDLLAQTEAELLNVPNLGQKSIDEVQEKLSERGLNLRSED